MSWESAIHHVRTAYGCLDTTYRSSKETPLFGLGKDSTTGPDLWGIMFQLLAKNMKVDRRKISFQSPDGSLSIRRLGDAFVEDSQLGCVDEQAVTTGNRPESVEQIGRRLTRELQGISQRWEKLLFTTGGALNLQKSFWLLLTWQWRNGIAQLSTTADLPVDLKLTLGYSNTPIVIPRINPDDGFCTLGVYIAANGSVEEAKRHLQHISLGYAIAITGSTLSCQAALWSYFLYFLPKFAYSAPTLTLTEDECHLH
jgi:hypothetical protein